jgi:hypothetical protein
MLVVASHTSLASIQDPDLRQLIWLRITQLADDDVYDPERHGELFVVEPGDQTHDVEVAVDFPITTNVIDGARYGDPEFAPLWDVIEEHMTCFEIVFAVNDSGFAVFVPKQYGVDATLLSLCAEFSVPAADLPR